MTATIDEIADAVIACERSAEEAAGQAAAARQRGGVMYWAGYEQAYREAADALFRLGNRLAAAS